ncbi:hypothetical protein Aperf_G00000117428 [Anoplocephala perfoliata]
MVKNAAKAACDDLQDTICCNITEANRCDLMTLYQNQRSTNDLLTRYNRVSDVLSTLRICEKQLSEAISRQSDSKESIERNIQRLQELESFNVQCLTLRDRRRGIDYVEDKPDIELRKEKQILLKNIKLMQIQVDKILNKIIRLKEIRQRILKDIEDKQTAKDIDLKQINLKSIAASLKVNPTATPRNMLSMREWDQFSRQNICLGNKETSEESVLYNESNQLIASTGIETGEQCKTVHAALRERDHELIQAIDQCEWEKKETEYNINTALCEIERLEGLLREELNRTKVAETRLENRKARPGVELCNDLPHQQLLDEVGRLDITRAFLKEQKENYRSET